MARLDTPSLPRNDRTTPPIPTTPQQMHPQDATTSTDTPRKNPPSTLIREHTFSSLTTEIATKEAQLIPALKLIAESVAQQRQLAAGAVIFHWHSLALIAAVFIYAHFSGHDSPSDFSRVFMTCIGVMIAGLFFVRSWASGYIVEAERVGTVKWLLGDDPSPNILAIAQGRNGGRPEIWKQFLEDGGAQGVDIVVITTFAEKVIATVALRILEVPDAHGPDSTYTAFIRAWTVEQRYRGVGVGLAILRDTAMLCVEADIKLAFADLHANSLRILPENFNYKMDFESDRAKKYLDKLIVESKEQFQPGAPPSPLRNQFDKQFTGVMSMHCWMRDSIQAWLLRSAAEQ